jgi:uncharacterized membrane protein HdeD (DUF308 family)
MVDRTTMHGCPMANACKGMSHSGPTRTLMFLPGLLFIAFGVAIIFFPQILAWLIAIALISVGFAMLAMARFMRSMGD